MNGFKVSESNMNISNSNIPTSAAVVFGFLFILLLPFDKIFVPFDLAAFNKHYLGDGLKNIIIIVYGIVLIRRFGYMHASGITNFRPKHKFLFILPLYFLLFGPIQYYLLGYQFDNIHWIDVLILFASMITVGISEEVIFRGFVLPNLIEGSSTNQPLIVPIITASFLFGILHFLNLLQPDKYFPLVLSQVIYATMFGVAFGIILLRTGSILPLGLLHGLINFSSNLDDLPGTIEPKDVELYRDNEAVLAILVVLPFLIYTIRQLSKIDRKELIASYNR